jgi:hypothetical protein
MIRRLPLGVSPLRAALMATAAALCLTACASAPDEADAVADPFAPQPERVLRLLDEQARRGVARERALYPHHFAPEAAELTDLGKATVAAIAEQLPAQGGSIRVSTGAATPELAAARVQSVAQRLQELGVPADRVVVANGLPGGQGGATIDVLAAGAKATAQPLRLGAPITTPSDSRK